MIYITFQLPTYKVEQVKIYWSDYNAEINFFSRLHQVAKQLFEPLTMQLIHWFTSSKQSGNEERDALLDSVYVSILRETDRQTDTQTDR